MAASDTRPQRGKHQLLKALTLVQLVCAQHGDPIWVVGNMCTLEQEADSIEQPSAAGSFRPCKHTEWTCSSLEAFYNLLVQCASVRRTGKPRVGKVRYKSACYVLEIPAVTMIFCLDGFAQVACSALSSGGRCKPSHSPLKHVPASRCRM